MLYAGRQNHMYVFILHYPLQQTSSMFTVKEKLSLLNNALSKMEEAILRLEQNQKLQQENQDTTFSTLQAMKSDMKESITNIASK